jgi:hypothetical protein
MDPSKVALWRELREAAWTAESFWNGTVRRGSAMKEVKGLLR